MSRNYDVASSWFASALRLGAGSAVRAPGRRPDKPFELYEFEACPFCRRVREALSEFDLDAMILPCPKGGTRFRPKAQELGGNAQFPYLVDPNTGRALYESAEIVKVLARDLRPTRGALVAGATVCRELHARCRGSCMPWPQGACLARTAVSHGAVEL